jgi:hypothetical protein
VGGYNVGAKRRQPVSKTNGNRRITVANENISKVGKFKKNVKVESRNFRLIQKTMDSLRESDSQRQKPA